MPSPKFSPGRSPRLPHLLSREDRKVSAPVIGSRERALVVDENHLERTEDVENIPEVIEEGQGHDERLTFHLSSTEHVG